MPRSSYDYTQLGLGICGHVVGTWPQITDLGGRNPQVICDTCTREKYALPDDEVLTVWVPLKPDAKKIAAKVAVKKKAPKKAKPLSPWNALMQEELF